MSKLPPTSKDHYITGITALNVPLPEEGYGDWHFNEAFFGRGDRPPKIFVAGEGEDCNTNPIFGEFGVYECADKLRQLGVEVPQGQTLYVAGHYRAVLDMLYLCVKRGDYPYHLDKDFHRCYFYGGLAQLARNHLIKGTQVHIAGSLRYIKRHGSTSRDAYIRVDQFMIAEQSIMTKAVYNSILMSHQRID